MIMKKIFISYRRVDSYETNRLATSLKNEYGDNNVFLDFESIHAGEEWPFVISRAIEEASVLIVVIGKNWLFMQDEFSGRRKIDMPNDWVRKEIITCLNRIKSDKNLLILPVLINGAKMPQKEFLDDEINGLINFQAIEIPNTMSQLDFAQIKSRLSNAGFYSMEPGIIETPVGKPPPASLTNEEEEAFLAKYKFWQIKEREKPGSGGQTIRELYRVFEFNSYDDARNFMSIIDEKAIKPNNHHPRWQNAHYRVEVWLCTSNAKHRPTIRDTELAEIMEKTWDELKNGSNY